MSRKPTFSIRSLMVLTLLVSVAIVALTVMLRPTPRPYKPLDRFTNGYIARGWSVQVAPDLDGPYRTAGDDRSSAGTFHCNSGQPAKGWVDSGTSRRSFNYPGRVGVSYIVTFLETRDDEPTYLIMSKPDGGTIRDSGGG